MGRALAHASRGALAALAAETCPAEASLDQVQITTTCMLRYLQMADPELLPARSD